MTSVRICVWNAGHIRVAGGGGGQVSSGAGIVHSGGESLHTVTLSNFLEGLRENDGSGVSATAFTFDLEFIESNKGECMRMVALVSNPRLRSCCTAHAGGVGIATGGASYVTVFSK